MHQRRLGYRGVQNARQGHGTYVREEGRGELFVHMDEVSLRGSGVIRLGRGFGDEAAPEIEYRIV